MEYELLEADTRTDLKHQVEEKFADGWILYGIPIVYNEHITATTMMKRYYQAMIRVTVPENVWPAEMFMGALN